MIAENETEARDWRALTWERAFFEAGRKGRPIRSAGEYVGVCRRLARGPLGDDLPLLFEGEGRVDGRLVAAGWNRYSPTEWIGGRLQAFIRYWERAAGNPGAVGSCYNPDPEQALACQQAGLPPWTVMHAHRAWPSLVRPGRPPRRCSPARMARVLAVARACTRASLAHAGSLRPDECTGNLLYALGRLSPELQEVAVATIEHDRRLPDCWPTQNRKARVTDVDWARVARVRDMLRADRSGRVRVALSLRGEEAKAGARTGWLLQSEARDREVSDVIAPAFRGCLPLPLARRLCLGESPAQLAGGGLGAAEAHAWCADGAPDIGPWLAARLGVPQVRSEAVARWLADVRRRGGWGQLERERVLHGPAGQEIVWRYLDRLDEVQDADLARGPRTSVEAAFASAAQRLGEAAMAHGCEDNRVLRGLPAGWRPYRCMRPLLTRRQLADEGSEMGHCVGGYAQAVEGGQSVIFAVRLPGGRKSTVELSPTGQVYQHRGPGNADPDPVCERLIERFRERRIGGGR